MKLSQLAPCFTNDTEINRKQSELTYYSGNALKQRAFHMNYDHLYIQVHHVKNSHYELEICSSLNDEIEVLYALSSKKYNDLFKAFKAEFPTYNDFTRWIENQVNTVLSKSSDEDKELLLRVTEFCVKTPYVDLEFKTVQKDGTVHKTDNLKDLQKSNLKSVTVYCFSQGACEQKETFYTLVNDFGVNEEYAPFVQHTKTSYSTYCKTAVKEGAVVYAYQHVQGDYFWAYDSFNGVLYFDQENCFKKDAFQVKCSKEYALEILKLDFLELYKKHGIQDDFEDYIEAVEKSVNENYSGTKEDFLIDYVHLKVKVFEEASDYRLGTQQIKSYYSEKGLSEELLYKLSVFDVVGLYDESNYHVTYYTGFRKKPVTNYSIRYKLVFSRPLYTYETDLLTTEFGLKG